MAGAQLKALAFLSLAGLVLALPGCREEEQGRVLVHDPGVYQGQSDQPLAPEQVESLRQRTQGQRF